MFGRLCLVDDVSVVTVSLAVNLISLESVLVSLSSGVPFVRILQLLDEQYNSEEGEVPKKMCQISLPFKNSSGFSPVGSDSTVLCCFGDCMVQLYH